jgi:hypothetical protein
MRLPDFIFGRDRDREAAEGLQLAGVVVTDFTKSEEQLTAVEWREIELFVDWLAVVVDAEPGLREAGYWRKRALRDPLALPLAEEVMRERMVGHLILTFEVDQAGMVCVTCSELMSSRAAVDENIRRGMH